MIYINNTLNCICLFNLYRNVARGVRW